MIQRANGDPPQCLDLMMYDQSIAAGFIVNRYLNMYGMSHIEHNITIHDFVYITDNAYLKGPGIMTNPPNKLINFDQSAYIGEDYTVVGNCIFQLPWNFNYGTIQGNLSAYGGGLTARLGNVTGTATLTDDIYDDLFLP